MNIDLLDVFTRQYLETALWSSNDNSNDQGGKPLDKNYGIKDFSEDFLLQAKEDCEKFQKMAGEMILEDLSGAGHDFWLTRNGHGAGFWDGDWEEKIGKKLTKLSKSFGEINIEVGDDSKLY